MWRPREFALMGLQIWEGMDVDRISGFNPDASYFVETVGTVNRAAVQHTPALRRHRRRSLGAGAGARHP